MEQADISLRIRRVFVRSLGLNLSPDEISPTLDLGSVAGLNSLAILEFVAGLEEEFGVEIEPDQLTVDFLGNLQDMAAYFSERLRSGC